MFRLRTLALFWLIAASPMAAQSSPTLGIKRPKPLTFFLRSLMVPGWGQAQLDRKFTGGLFIAVEGVSLGMGLKAHYDLSYLERTHSNRLKDKRAEREDWFFLLAVNHLLAGMEAYVSASLYDFPGDLHATALDNGRTGIGLTLPLRKKP